MNVATYLDPRYKELPFLSYTSKRTVIDQVEDELLSTESLESTKPTQKRLRKAPCCLSSRASRIHSQTRLRKS